MRGWLRVAQEWRLLAKAVDLTASLPWHRLQTGRLERSHGCLNHKQGGGHGPACILASIWHPSPARTS
jgi:hypothetical protein